MRDPPARGKKWAEADGDGRQKEQEERGRER